MAKAIKRGFTLTHEQSGDGHTLRGVHYARHGYAPLSGLCPSAKAAKKAALK